METAKLNYYLPKLEKKHTILQIPGSHTLYVGPPSCTRRHAVNASKYGNRGDVSFLFVTQGDVISGTYEDMIAESIGKLAECLEPEPHIYIIAVFCIDDFLGTDEDALIDRLEREYPGRQFAIQHVDPVALDERVNMATKKTSSLYSFLKPAAIKDKGINFIGNFVSLPDDCEFPNLLSMWGFGPIREIFNMTAYEEYEAMAGSALNVVLRFMADKSGEYMEEKLGIPYYTFHSSYDPERIWSGYMDIAGMLEVPDGDWKQLIGRFKEEALDEITQTVRLLDGCPVAIDSNASIPTFQTARTLLRYGFNLRWIFRSGHKFKIDAADEDYIMNNCPEVKVTLAADYKNFIQPEDTECLALGTDCARVLRAAHCVDIWHDEGYFGFQGVKRLMREMRKAFATDWADKEIRF